MSYHACAVCDASRPRYLLDAGARCVCLDYMHTATVAQHRSRTWRAADGVVVTCRQAREGGPTTVDGIWSRLADVPRVWPRDVDGRTSRMFADWARAMDWARQLVGDAERATT